VQLENLLTQMLAPGQFERNVSTTGTGERVEFAIKLPGQDAGTVWLPIDAKFPAEAYQRLVAASERGDVLAVELCAKELETVVRTCAKTFSGNISRRRRPPISGFSSSRRKDCTPKFCADPVSPNRFRRITASCSRVRPRSPLC